MRKINENERAKGSRAAQLNDFASGVSNSLPGKICAEWPEEFEEYRIVNFSRKRQVIVQLPKKKEEEKEEIGNDN